MVGIAHSGTPNVMKIQSAVINLQHEQMATMSDVIMGNDIITEDHSPTSQVKASVTLVLPTGGN